MAKHLAILALCALAIPFVAEPAFAQSDVSVGYQFVRLSTADGPLNLPQGVGIEYAHPIADGWRVLGVFGWARKNESGPVDAFAVDTTFTQLTFGAGVRRDVTTRMKATPYVQAVVGVARSSFRAASDGVLAIDDASSDPLLEPGVGVASNLGGPFALFAQLDYRKVWPGAHSAIFFNETVQGPRARLPTDARRSRLHRKSPAVPG
jgi:hypothetical protein